MTDAGPQSLSQALKLRSPRLLVAYPGHSPHSPVTVACLHPQTDKAKHPGPWRRGTVPTSLQPFPCSGWSSASAKTHHIPLSLGPHHPQTHLPCTKQVLENCLDGLNLEFHLCYLFSVPLYIKTSKCSVLLFLYIPTKDGHSV